MKKIMFSDKYGLTNAVLQGRKTMTRRKEKSLDNAIEMYRNSYTDSPEFNVLSQRYTERGGIELRLERDFLFVPTRYKVGEVVAVAQSYNKFIKALPDRIRENIIGYYAGSKAFDNKFYVCPDLMPHQIRITDIKVERLQDISDEDCFKEGLMKMFWGYCYEYHDRHGRSFKGSDSIRDAFADLIDGISGKGTWALNPFVFVYSFELVK